MEKGGMVGLFSTVVKLILVILAIKIAYNFATAILVESLGKIFGVVLAYLITLAVACIVWQLECGIIELLSSKIEGSSNDDDDDDSDDDDNDDDTSTNQQPRGTSANDPIISDEAPVPVYASDGTTITAVQIKVAGNNWKLFLESSNNTWYRQKVGDPTQCFALFTGNTLYVANNNNVNAIDFDGITYSLTPVVQPQPQPTQQPQPQPTQQPQFRTVNINGTAVQQYSIDGGLSWIDVPTP